MQRFYCSLKRHQVLSLYLCPLCSVLLRFWATSYISLSLLFGGFSQNLTSNLLPEILTRDKHEERAEKRDLELSKSWEPTKKRVTWCLPQTSEVVICGLYPCEHVIPGPLRTHAKPDSAALGVQLCMYKGKPPGLKWQSLINLCRCRFAIRATNFRGTPLRNFTEASS